MEKDRILIVDDEQDICDLIGIIFETGNYETRSAGSGKAALSSVMEFSPFVVLLDYMLPDMDGLDVLKRIKTMSPDTEVIMITGRGSEEIAVKLMKSGASEYIVKPFDFSELRQKVHENLQLRQDKIRQRERDQERLQKENLLHKELQKDFSFDFVGVSEIMRVLLDQIKVIAQRDVTVLIRGESGTGKELVARIIHSHSQRRTQPFLTVNCAAITETLIESELFGHEKGAFTGADNKRLGKFELANGGTLFLDEIGDMSLTTQAKVLRVIQERQFERVGGERSIKTDIRIITATHRNLEDMCRKGQFRDDLFYRINVHPIKIPPLAERHEDIPVLFDYFVKVYCREFSKYLEKIDVEVYRRISSYNWPGNVRELRNIVERVIMLARKPILTLSDMPDEIVATEKGEMNDSSILPLKDAVNNCKKQMLIRALKKCDGNRTQAAKKLGVSLRHVQNMINTFQLD